MTPFDPNAASPVDYPTVTIGGAVYAVKYGPGAMLRAERLGIPFGGTVTNRPVTTWYTWLAAMAGTLAADGTWHPISLTPEQIADAMDSSLIDVIAACSAAIKKANPNPTAQPGPVNPPIQ